MNKIIGFFIYLFNLGTSLYEALFQAQRKFASFGESQIYDASQRAGNAINAGRRFTRGDAGTLAESVEGGRPGGYYSVRVDFEVRVGSEIFRRSHYFKMRGDADWQRIYDRIDDYINNIDSPLSAAVADSSYTIGNVHVVSIL